MTDTTLLRRGIDELVGLLSHVGPDTAGRPTPCSDWTVADLGDHIVWSTSGMVTMARGGEVDWSSGPEHQDDPASAFSSTADELVAALAGDGSQFPMGMALGELAVHAYDLSTGLGRSTGDLDPEVADTGYAFMSEALTAENRGDAFGPPQEAPDGADPYQRLAAFAGRTV